MLSLLVLVCSMLPGCATKRPAEVPQPPVMDTGWQVRTLGFEELEALSDEDPALDQQACLEMLARLNQKDRVYIKEDMKRQRPIRVPNDFTAFKTWSPLPRSLSQIRNEKQFILVSKDIPFLGWYEEGNLAGDTHICIGKKPKWTRAGLYQVKEKAVNHVSSSYRNAYGGPAWMPYAMRIYDRVWIHAGDITGGYCSHGCINLPLDAAAELFKWARAGTHVLIVESLGNLDRALKKYSEILALPR